ncbi:MAG: efflux RND transporter periplasmic adaptor subunit [Cyanobacteriota bacterium]|nr:efflux RND transporter periplasmic adaptor subunit [Cyanobacteriota bacterium]
MTDSHRPQPTLESTNESTDESNLAETSLEEHPPESPQEPVGVAESSPPPPRRWWAILAIVVLLSGGVGFWQGRQSQSQSAAPTQGRPDRPVKVELTPIESQTLQDAERFEGELEAEDQAMLRAEVDGRLVEIYVEPGDAVERGQVIAQIDRAEAEVEVSQAAARLSGAEARLAELQVGTREEEIAQARSRVDRAEAEVREAQAALELLEAGTRPEEIAEAEASVAEENSAVAEAESRLDLARDRVRRNTQLEADGAISRDDLDVALDEERRAEANLGQAKAAVAEAQERVRRLENGSRTQEIDRAAAEVATAEAEAEEARQELRELENGATPEEIAQAQADVELALAELEASQVGVRETVLLAPISGIIGDIEPKVGDYLREGDELTSVIQNSALKLNLSVSLERASQLDLGLPVEIFDTFDTEEKEVLGVGRVSFISPTVDSDSQLKPIEVLVENESSQLTDGRGVIARIVFRERPSAIVVPSNAIVFQGEQRFVYIAEGTEELVAKKVAVELGENQGDRTEVLRGLQPGDRLIVSGLQKMADGKAIVTGEN